MIISPHCSCPLLLTSRLNLAVEFIFCVQSCTFVETLKQEWTSKFMTSVRSQREALNAKEMVQWRTMDHLRMNALYVKRVLEEAGRWCGLCGQGAARSWWAFCRRNTKCWITAWGFVTRENSEREEWVMSVQIRLCGSRVNFC